MARNEKLSKKEVRREREKGEGTARSLLFCSVSPSRQEKLRVCLLGAQCRLRLASLCSNFQITAVTVHWAVSHKLHQRLLHSHQTFSLLECSCAEMWCRMTRFCRWLHVPGSGICGDGPFADVRRGLGRDTDFSLAFTQGASPPPLGGGGCLVTWIYEIPLKYVFRNG